MEIYCEKVKDLLNPKKSQSALRIRYIKLESPPTYYHHGIPNRENRVLGPFVEGLLKVAVQSFDKIKSLMDEGNRVRWVV